jgi:uncharacterized membrane protein YbaN (DUF454 family)
VDQIMTKDEETMNDEREIRRITALPKEVGVLLVVAGVAGVLLPGPVGTPFLIVGGIMLWPRAFGRAEICVEKWFPRTHHHGVRQMTRFLNDLERRYPIPK